MTLRDADHHIAKLPKAERESLEWQAAMAALIMVAESGGPTMMARMGVMMALNRHVVREFKSDRKEATVAPNLNSVWGTITPSGRPLNRPRP